MSATGAHRQTIETIFEEIHEKRVYSMPTQAPYLVKFSTCPLVLEIGFDLTLFQKNFVVASTDKVVSLTDSVNVIFSIYSKQRVNYYRLFYCFFFQEKSYNSFTLEFEFLQVDFLAPSQF